MRGTPHLVRNILGLCLPTLAAIALLIRFALTDVPRIVDGERQRIDALCEEESRSLLNRSVEPDFVWRRGAGIVTGDSAYAERYPATLTWRDWPSRGRAKTKEKWGFEERPEGRLVWVRDTAPGGDASCVLGRQTDLAVRDYRKLFAVFGGILLLVLVGVTLMGVRFFVRSVRNRDDFMAATAHDLTTPLVGLRYAIGRDAEEARALNERLIRLVENIKDFLRLGGRRKPRVETVDLRAAYDEAYALYRADYRDLFDGHDVAVSGPEDDGPVLVRADPTLVVQILWNLLGNDLKYAAPYGTVRVAFRRESKMVAVDFIDEGKGMTPREMKRAFDRYYRAKTVIESGKGGFGIGLCTAREFAEAMGGALTVRANEPTGCIFTLTLPAASLP